MALSQPLKMWCRPARQERLRSSGMRRSTRRQAPCSTSISWQSPLLMNRRSHYEHGLSQNTSVNGALLDNPRFFWTTDGYGPEKRALSFDGSGFQQGDAWGFTRSPLDRDQFQPFELAECPPFLPS